MNQSPSITIPLPPLPAQRLLAIACDNAPTEVNALVVHGPSNIPIKIPVLDFQVQLMALVQAMFSSLLGTTVSGSGSDWSAAEMITPEEVRVLASCNLDSVYRVLNTNGNKLGSRPEGKKRWLITFGQATSWIRSCNGAVDEVRLWNKLMAHRAEQKKRKAKRNASEQRQDDTA